MLEDRGTTRRCMQWNCTGAQPVRIWTLPLPMSNLISVQLKEAIVPYNEGESAEECARRAACSVRTRYFVMSTWKEFGTVQRPQDATRGRRRTLTTEDIEFLGF